MKRNQNIGICILIAILMVFTMGGMYQAVGVLAKSLDKGLNPIPVSPAPPEEFYEDFKKSSKIEDEFEIINDKPGYYIKSPSKHNSELNTYSNITTTVNSKLNSYAVCDCYINDQAGAIYVGDHFEIGYSNPNLQKCTLLMYPQVRDIIPPVASINSVKLVTGEMDLSAQPVNVDIYEVTSVWDPRTFNATTLPSFSSQTIAQGTFDLASTTSTGRTIDITSTFNSWFSGSGNQWGIMITATPGSQSDMSLELPPRIYIDYEMPEGSYSGNSSGGTLYSDGICPDMWLPRRATYIAKEGILGQRVDTWVFAMSKTKPSFGKDLQGYYWNIGGVPTDPSKDSVPFGFDIQTVSPKSFNTMLATMPPVQSKMFSPGNELIAYQPCDFVPSNMNKACIPEYKLNSLDNIQQAIPGPSIENLFSFNDEEINPPIPDPCTYGDQPQDGTEKDAQFDLPFLESKFYYDPREEYDTDYYWEAPIEDQYTFVPFDGDDGISDNPPFTMQKAAPLTSMSTSSSHQSYEQVPIWLLENLAMLGLNVGNLVCMPIEGMPRRNGDIDGDEKDNRDDDDDDGDGIPDAQDNDQDGDGIPDTEDDDIDGDGEPNDVDKDDDDDGVFDEIDNNPYGPDPDTDGDSIPPERDIDDDNDGIPDDQDDDMDGDGVPNDEDDDTDGDGVPNDEDDDTDGDGVLNDEDDDDDNDSIPDEADEDPTQASSVTTYGDADGDGVPNDQDHDDDNDGIPDCVDKDQDGDGVPNDEDDDTDGDGMPNDVDPDDDDDGIPDEEDSDPNQSDDGCNELPITLPIWPPEGFPIDDELELYNKLPSNINDQDDYQYENLPRQWVQFTHDETIGESIDISEEGWVNDWRSPSRKIRTPFLGDLHNTSFILWDDNKCFGCVQNPASYGSCNNASYKTNSISQTQHNSNTFTDDDPPQFGDAANEAVGLVITSHRFWESPPEVEPPTNDNMSGPQVPPVEKWWSDYGIEPPQEVKDAVAQHMKDIDFEAYDETLPQLETEESDDVGDGENEDELPAALVNPFNGSTEFSQNEFSIPCYGGLTIEHTRSYTSISSNTTSEIFGFGWFSNLNQSILPMAEGYFLYISPSGQTYSFTPVRNHTGQIIDYTSPPQLDSEVKVHDYDAQNIDINITPKNGFTTLHFEIRTSAAMPEGRIKRITSEIGGELVFEYDSMWQLKSITDTYSQRSITTTTDTYGRITSFNLPENRNVTYSYDSNGRIATYTNMEGGIWTYTYEGVTNKLIEIENPRGFSTYFTYNQNNKLSEISIDNISKTTTIEYILDDEGEESTVKITDPDGSIKEIFMNNNGTLEIINDNASQVRFLHDIENPEKIIAIFDQYFRCSTYIETNDDDRVSSIYDILGNTIDYTYNQQGKINSVSDKESNVTTIDWNNDGVLPVEITDPLGRITSYTYNNDNMLISISVAFKNGIDALTQYQYDTNGYVNKVIDALGNETEYEYNNMGELVSTTNSNGKTNTFTRNKMGSIVEIKGPSPDNRKVLYTYDENQNLTTVTNPRNFSTTYSYDSRDLCSKITNALDQDISYIYNDSGQLVEVKDDQNNSTYFEYNNIGKICKVTDPESNSIIYLYDHLGRGTSIYKNEDDIYKHIKYDALSRVESVENSENGVTYYYYDKEGHVTKVTDPMGKETTFEYDDCYRVTKVTDNDGNYSTVEYWPSGQIKKVTDPLNHNAYFDYNKLGATVSVKDHQLNETEMTYDNLGRLTETEDALGNTVSYVYDMYGMVTSVTNQLSKTTTFDYDVNGNLVKQTTPEGREYEWEYDELDRLKKSITPLGYEYIQRYDNVGNLVELEDPLTHLQKFEYTDDHKLEKYIDQINKETAYTYDDSERISKVTLPKGTYQEYEYDDMDRLNKVIDPVGNQATYTYNKVGALTERNLPNPAGGTTSFTYSYDTLGRRTGFTDEAGKTTSNTLNSIGQVTQLSHPNSKSISSTYDTLGRITGISFGGGESFSFGYDALSRATSATDAHGTKSITYDAGSRVTNLTDPFGDQYSFAYDDDNRATGITTPYGTTTTTYDDDSRPTSVSLAGGGTISNTFDNASRLTATTLPNSVNTSYTYNNANYPTQMNYSTSSLFSSKEKPVTKSCVEIPVEQEKDPFMDLIQELNNTNIDTPGEDSLFLQIGRISKMLSDRIDGIDNPTVGDLLFPRNPYTPYTPNQPLQTASTVANFTYTYDDNYNILSRTNPTGTEQFTYDNYDRLTEAQMDNGTYSYTYDSRSNMTSQTFVNTGQTVNQTTYYTHSVDDRLTGYTVEDNTTTPPTEIESVTYTYDDAGCMLSKAVTAGGNTDTTTYTYYDDLRIDTVTLPDSSTVTFTYHADGSRATKTTDTEYIEYHYAGGLVKEVHMDESNHSTVLFTVHYQPSRMIIDPGSTGGGDEVEYYPVTDVQGTVYKLLDSSGVEVADYTYSPFGERLTNSSPTIYMPLSFGGTYSDDDIGLLYAKSRYYDPHTTRFTTKDSYRGSKGSIISQNRYIYCHQNPILYADPAGYAPVEGDHADPCTTTDQDIHYEPNSSDLLPPEDLPNQANAIQPIGKKVAYNGKDYFIPDGFEDNMVTDEDGNLTGEFEISIGGLTLKVSIEMTGSGYNVVFSSGMHPLADPDDQLAAEGLAQGFNQAVDKITGFKSALLQNFGAFVRAMDMFYRSHYWEYSSVVGSKTMLGWFNDHADFAFCAAGGYTFAWNIIHNSADKLQGLEDVATELGYSSFLDYAMTHGFWATHCFMGGSEKGDRFLEINFYSDGNMGDPTSSYSVAKHAMTTFIYEATFGTVHGIIRDAIDGGDVNFGSLIGKLTGALGIIGSGLSGLAAGAGISSLATPVGWIALGLSVLAISFDFIFGEDPGGSRNKWGFKNSMMKMIRSQYNLKNEKIWWDPAKHFVAMGLVSMYSAAEAVERNNGNYKGLLLGHGVYGVAQYIGNSIDTAVKGVNEDDVVIAMNFFIQQFFDLDYWQLSKVLDDPDGDHDGDGIPNWRDEDWKRKTGRSNP